MYLKVRIIFFFLILVKGLYVDAQEVFTPPIKPNTAFIAGETLTFQIRYGIIVGGTTTLSIIEEVYNNKPVFHSLAIGKTTGVAETLYGVVDVYESWFDKVTNLPYKEICNIKEGHYKHFNEVTFDRKTNTINSKLSGVHDVPEKILDLSSTLYYIRRIDFSKFRKGDVIFVNMYFSDEIFPFRLRYDGKEFIRTKFGKINCLKISPVVEVGRMFKSPDDVTIWFTDDNNYIPVLVRMDIRVVGAVILKLINYQNIANPTLLEK